MDLKQIIRTEHQQRVEAFMTLAKQDVPLIPRIPDESVRLLRAKLIYEEAVEGVTALGCCRNDDGTITLKAGCGCGLSLVKIVKECCDISVVTMGTLSALGIADEEVLRIVDASNLSKFAEGYTVRGDGKIIKSPHFKQPYDELDDCLERLAKLAH